MNDGSKLLLWYTWTSGGCVDVEHPGFGAAMPGNGSRSRGDVAIGINASFGFVAMFGGFSGDI